MMELHRKERATEPFDYDLVTIPDSRWWRIKSTVVYYWLRLRDRVRKPKPYHIGR